MSSVVPSDFFNVTTRELWSMASIVNVAETTSAMLTGFCAAAGTASSAVDFVPRSRLVGYVRQTEGLALCGRGAPCPG